MTNLANKVLDELRDQDVRPVPAWRFVMQSVVAWIGFAILMIFGAQAVSIILFLLSDHDWTELAHFRGGPLGYLFVALPYVWILAMVALTVAAYLDFKKTKGGFRYRPLVVVGVVLGVSLLAGFGLHAMGMGKRADALLERQVPLYRQMAPRGQQIWDKPAQGRLVGEIERISEDGTKIELRTPAGEKWSVSTESVPGQRLLEQLKEGAQVRVVGQPQQGGEFKARMILPWEPGPKQRLKWRLNRRDLNREEMLQQARSTGERSMRPPVHPVAPSH